MILSKYNAHWLSDVQYLDWLDFSQTSIEAVQKRLDFHKRAYESLIISFNGDWANPYIEIYSGETLIDKVRVYYKGGIE
jgi:hypothetical protein